MVTFAVGVSNFELSAPAQASGTSSTAISSAGRCEPHVVYGVIPSWARAGFSEPKPKPKMHYGLSRDGDIAALAAR